MLPNSMLIPSIRSGSSSLLPSRRFLLEFLSFQCSSFILSPKFCSYFSPQSPYRESHFLWISFSRPYRECATRCSILTVYVELYSRPLFVSIIQLEKRSHHGDTVCPVTEFSIERKLEEVKTYRNRYRIIMALLQKEELYNSFSLNKI
jgi:hypothetical protein